MQPELVIFDNDGVLVDSETLSNRVLAELVTELGLPTDVDTAVEKYLGRRTTDCVADIAAELGRPVPDSFITDYERRCGELLRTRLRPIDGVPELLTALRRTGTPFCLASSGTPDEIALRLTVSGLNTFFTDNVHSAVEVPRGKPAPDLFEHAAARMGFAPADCVVIEDSPAGVRAGKAAGMTVIGHADLAGPDRLRAAGADHVVPAMTRVAALLGH